MVEPAWLRIRYEIEKGLRAVGVGCAKVDTSFWCWLMMTTDKRSSLHKKLSPRKSCHLRSVHIDFELDSRLDATFGMFSALGLSFYVILLQNTQWWAKARFLLHPSPISIGLRAHPPATCTNMKRRRARFFLTFKVFIWCEQPRESCPMVRV